MFLRFLVGQTSIFTPVSDSLDDRVLILPISPDEAEFVLYRFMSIRSPLRTKRLCYGIFYDGEFIGIALLCKPLESRRLRFMDRNAVVQIYKVWAVDYIPGDVLEIGFKKVIEKVGEDWLLHKDFSIQSIIGWVDPEEVVMYERLGFVLEPVKHSRKLLAYRSIV